jgi:serine/threonine protein kinase
MRLEFSCQKCGVIVEADSEFGGDLVQCPECDATIMVPMDAVGSGMVLGGYKVLHKLGSGGMGDVYLAEHATMQRRVALKVLPPAMTRDRKAAERFLQEVRNQAALNHPNIAMAYDAGHDRDIFYLAMEYVEGVDVQRILSKKSHMPERESLRVALEVARGLDYAWYRKKMIHRDVKPGNIIISKDADVQLLDMGLSLSMGDMDLSDTNFIIGTPLYMSPEQTDPDTVLDYRSDMYALGSTLYHMLCGRTPYEGKTVSQILADRARRDPPDIREINPAISEPCAAVVHILLARDPAQRFSDWATAIAGISQVLSKHRNATTSLITGIPDAPVVRNNASSTQLPRVKPGRASTVPTQLNPMVKVYLATLGVLALALTAGIIAMLKRAPRVVEVRVPTPTERPSTRAHPPPANEPKPRVPPDNMTNGVASAIAAEKEQTRLEAARIARAKEATQVRADYAERMAVIREDPHAFDTHIAALENLASRTHAMNLESLAAEVREQGTLLQEQRRQAIDGVMKKINRAIADNLKKADYPAAIQQVKNYTGPLAQETAGLRQQLQEKTEGLIRQHRAKAAEAGRKAALAYTTLIEHLAGLIISNRTSEVTSELGAAKNRADLGPMLDKIHGLMASMNLLNELDERILLTFKSQLGQAVEMDTPEGPVVCMIKDLDEEAVTVVRQVEDNGPIVGSVEMKLSPRDLSGTERVKRIEESYGEDTNFVLGFLALRAQREQTAQNYFRNVDNDLTRVLARELDPVIEQKEANERKAAAAQLEREARWAFSSLLHSTMLPADMLAPEALIAALDRSTYDESRIRVVRLMSNTYRTKYAGTQFAGSYESFLNRLSNMRYYPVITVEALKRGLKGRNPGYNGGGVFESDKERIVKVDLLEVGSIQDITPLNVLPLTDLRLAGAGIQDLAPLKGMPLRTLILSGTGVEDIRALAELPIENLSLKGSTRIRNLEALKHLPLKKLNLSGTQVKRLDALKALTQLNALDLLDTPVENLSALAELPLQVLKFKPGTIKKGLETLRESKTLRQIMIDDSSGILGVEEFWRRYDAGRLEKTDQAETPAGEQAE